MLGLVIPYAINELLRIFSWVMILEKQGILNGVLDALGLIDMTAGEGIRFVASNGAVFDANAIKVNWDRASLPENRSPAFSFMASMTVSRLTAALRPNTLP